MERRLRPLSAELVMDSLRQKHQNEERRRVMEAATAQVKAELHGRPGPIREETGQSGRGHILGGVSAEVGEADVAVQLSNELTSLKRALGDKRDRLDLIENEVEGLSLMVDRVSPGRAGAPRSGAVGGGGMDVSEEIRSLRNDFHAVLEYCSPAASRLGTPVASPRREFGNAAGVPSGSGADSVARGVDDTIGNLGGVGSNLGVRIFSVLDALCGLLQIQHISFYVPSGAQGKGGSPSPAACSPCGPRRPSRPCNAPVVSPRVAFVRQIHPAVYAPCATASRPATVHSRRPHCCQGPAGSICLAVRVHWKVRSSCLPPGASWNM